MARADQSLSAGGGLALAQPEVVHAARRFRSLRVFLTQKPLGVFGAAIVLLLAFFAIFGPAVSPYSPATIFKAKQGQTATPADCAQNPYSLKCLTLADDAPAPGCPRARVVFRPDFATAKGP